jgi:hypothetical protein
MISTVDVKVFISLIIVWCDFCDMSDSTSTVPGLPWMLKFVIIITSELDWEPHSGGSLNIWFGFTAIIGCSALGMDIALERYIAAVMQITGVYFSLFFDPWFLNTNLNLQYDVGSVFHALGNIKSISTSARIVIKHVGKVCVAVDLNISQAQVLGFVKDRGTRRLSFETDRKPVLSCSSYY